MECPYCGGSTRVIDSRPISEGIRRRRECDDCGRRFTTHERLAPVDLRVIKRDGHGEEFDPGKIEAALDRVLRPQALPAERVRQMVRRVELKLQDYGRAAISSWELAMLLLDELRETHPLGYHRFLANYTDADGELLPPPQEVDEKATAPQLGLSFDNEGGEPG